TPAMPRTRAQLAGGTFPTRRSSDLSTAERTQASLREFLDSQPVSYESFWIANVVRVDGADAELVERLAARPAVWQITADKAYPRSEEHTSELQSRENIVCRPLLATK